MPHTGVGNKQSRGLKEGTPGVVKDNSPIQDNIWCKNWASPLNAYNSGDPGPDPRQGGILEVDKMEEVPNPLRIPNVDFGTGVKGPKTNKGYKG